MHGPEWKNPSREVCDAAWCVFSCAFSAGRLKISNIMVFVLWDSSCAVSESRWATRCQNVADRVRIMPAMLQRRDGPDIWIQVNRYIFLNHEWHHHFKLSKPGTGNKNPWKSKTEYSHKCLCPSFLHARHRLQMIAEILSNFLHYNPVCVAGLCCDFASASIYLGCKDQGRGSAGGFNFHTPDWTVVPT